MDSQLCVHERIIDYSEDLLKMMPDEIDKIMFMCTGSEANDLALRVAQEYTGGTGIIVSREAYHGTSALYFKYEIDILLYRWIWQIE